MTKYNYTDCIVNLNSESVGLLSPMPQSIVIDNCDSIHIYQGTLDIKFNLPTDLEQFDSLIINGVTFERKEPEQEGEYILRLPCMPGTTVYKVYPKCKRGSWCPDNGGYGEARCRYPNGCEPYIATTPFHPDMLDKVGKFIFLTEEQALIALEKLKKE